MKNLIASLLIALLICPYPAFATVTTLNNSASFACTGSTGPYPFSFPISDPPALQVVENGTTLASALYTVVPVNGYYDNGGSVTLNTACANGTLLLQRSTPLTQTSAFVAFMPTLYKTFENGLDKLTEMEQDIFLKGGGGGNSGMVYCPSGICQSSGAGWLISYQVGTAANDLVQLNSSGQLPAVSGALLTNLPGSFTQTWPGNPGFVYYSGSNTFGVSYAFSGAGNTVTLTNAASVSSWTLANTTFTGTVTDTGLSGCVQVINGVFTSTGTLCNSSSGGSNNVVWPSSTGVTVYAGNNQWGAPYQVGTAANDLVQLNSSGQLPALNGALLVGVPSNMVWPANAGIAVYGGGNAWGVPYTASGYGQVLAAVNQPQLIDPYIMPVSSVAYLSIGAGSQNFEIVGSFGTYIFTTNGIQLPLGQSIYYAQGAAISFGNASVTHTGQTVFNKLPISSTDFETTTPSPIHNIGYGARGAANYVSTLGPASYIEKWAGNVPAQSSGTWDTALTVLYHNYDQIASNSTSGVAPVGIQSEMLDYGNWSNSGGGSVAVGAHAIAMTSTSLDVWGGWFVAGLEAGANVASNASAIGIEIDVANGQQDVGYPYANYTGTDTKKVYWDIASTYVNDVLTTNESTEGLRVIPESAGTTYFPGQTAIAVAGTEPAAGTQHQNWYSGIMFETNAIHLEQIDPVNNNYKVGEAIMMLGASNVPNSAAGIRYRGYHTTGIDFSGATVNTGIDFSSGTFAYPIVLPNSNGIYGVYSSSIQSMMYISNSDVLTLGQGVASTTMEAASGAYLTLSGSQLITNQPFYVNEDIFTTATYLILHSGGSGTLELTPSTLVANVPLYLGGGQIYSQTNTMDILTTGASGVIRLWTAYGEVLGVGGSGSAINIGGTLCSLSRGTVGGTSNVVQCN